MKWIGPIRWAPLIALVLIGGPLALAETTTAPASQPAGPAATQPVAFAVYDGYFVSNQFEANQTRSFVVIHNQAEFDAVFGSAFVMNDRSHRLAANVFDASIVLGVIRRGNVLWHYSMTGATVSDGVLTIHYAAAADAPGQAQFSSSLIVSVPKGDYREIQFEENGDFVGSRK